jgi:serine/threonine protein kinase
VVHRDIKPSNLMVNAEGHLWITDFGLAQIQADAGITITGDILGTLRYMSPEQAQGNRRGQDHRSDIYSLGVTLYELLALKPPFASHDRHALLHEIADGTPPPLRQLNRSIPRDLETIVLKALATDPPARYATAQQMADDLKRFVAHEPIRARRPTLADRMTKWSRRHRPAVGSALAFLVLAAIGLAASTFLIAREQTRTAEAYQGEKEQRELADEQKRIAQEQERIAREQERLAVKQQQLVRRQA